MSFGAFKSSTIAPFLGSGFLASFLGSGFLTFEGVAFAVIPAAASAALRARFFFSSSAT